MFKLSGRRLLFGLALAILVLLATCGVATASLYTSGGGDNVKVYDPASGATSTIGGFIQAYQLALSPDYSKLYVADGDRVAIVDTAGNTIVDSIYVGSSVYDIALSGDSRLYVQIRPTADTTEIHIFNTETKAHLGAIHLSSVPVSMALSPDGGRLYIVESDPTGTMSYSNITICDAYTLEKLDVEPRGYLHVEAVTLSPQGDILYLRGTDGQGISKVAAHRTNDLTGIGSVEVPPGNDIVVKPDGNRVYVSNYADHSVSVLNAYATEVLETITITQPPIRSAFSTVGGVDKLYLSCDNGYLTTIDTGNGSVSSVNLGYNAFYLAWKNTVTINVGLLGPLIIPTPTPVPAPTFVPATPTPAPEATAGAATPTEPAVVSPTSAPATPTESAATAAPTASPGADEKSVKCLGVPILSIGAVIALGPLSGALRKRRLP